MTDRRDILALDLASTVGWAEGPPGELPRSGIIKLGSAEATAGERYWAMFRWLWERLGAFKPAEIVYEAPLPPAFARGSTNVDTTAFLFGVPAVVETVAQARGVYRVTKANVQDVRGHFIGGRGFLYRGKPIVGRRNLASAEAKHCTMERCRELGITPATHDEADAIALHSYISAIRAPATASRETPLFARATA